MFSKEWEILIVDDDEDVLQVSMLALKTARVSGVPLKIFTARSKAEALDILHNKLMLKDGLNMLHVALIDIVMETDTAGLELVQAIRAADTDNYTQIYVRTGQPGLAPERDVMDRYEINGYFSKAEMTEDKLYSLVTAGVRQSAFVKMSVILSRLQRMMIEAGRDRKTMTAILNGIINSLETTTDGESIDSHRLDFVFTEGDQVIGGRESVVATKNRLQKLPSVAIGDNGDSYVIDGKQMLIHVKASDKTSDIYYAVDSLSNIRTLAVPHFYNFARSLAALWKQSSLELQAQ